MRPVPEKQSRNSVRALKRWSLVGGARFPVLPPTNLTCREKSLLANAISKVVPVRVECLRGASAGRSGEIPKQKPAAGQPKLPRCWKFGRNEKPIGPSLRNKIVGIARTHPNTAAPSRPKLTRNLNNLNKRLKLWANFYHGDSGSSRLAEGLARGLTILYSRWSQPASQDPKETRASAKLGLASSLFQKFSAESAPSFEGAVVIFDFFDCFHSNFAFVFRVQILQSYLDNN